MCPLCLSPSLLPCEHVFCRQCITSYLESHEGAHKCPECRQNFTRQDLKGNRVLRNIVDILQQQQQQLKIRQQTPRTAEEMLCSEHMEPLKLLCESEPRLVCLICKEGERHTGYSFRPVKEAMEIIISLDSYIQCDLNTFETIIFYRFMLRLDGTQVISDHFTLGSYETDMPLIVWRDMLGSVKHGELNLKLAIKKESHLQSPGKDYFAKFQKFHNGYKENYVENIQPGQVYWEVDLDITQRKKKGSIIPSRVRVNVDNEKRKVVFCNADKMSLLHMHLMTCYGYLLESFYLKGRDEGWTGDFCQRQQRTK
uniref:Uncharacterized protein n=1 Tax=Cyprinus carpio TaxID=7962 RepID=A0A8C2ETI7_CYPCA